LCLIPLAFAGISVLYFHCKVKRQLEFSSFCRIVQLEFVHLINGICVFSSSPPPHSPNESLETLLNCGYSALSLHPAEEVSEKAVNKKMYIGCLIYMNLSQQNQSLFK